MSNEDAVAAYRIVNRWVLLVMVICIGLVAVAHFCGINTCWLRSRYGIDCFLCGCTRDFVSIVRTGETGGFNSASVFVFLGLTMELVWRVLGSLVELRMWAIKMDVILHTIAIIALCSLNLSLIIKYVNCA